MRVLKIYEVLDDRLLNVLIDCWNVLERVKDKKKYDVEVRFNRIKHKWLITVYDAS